MVKTLVEKVTSPKPDVTIFKISGTLGFHENEVITKFFGECQKKGITKLVMDFSSLTSLGGGCAKIIRKHADAGSILLCIAGASQFVKKYLDDSGSSVLFASDVARAVDLVDATDAPEPKAEKSSDPLEASVDEILDVESADEAPEAPQEASEAVTASKPGSPVTVPEDDGNGNGTEAAAVLEAKDTSAGVPSEPPPEAKAPAKDDVEARDLHKKLIQYRSLLSLTTDFNRIQDKGRLLDAFLLTVIAQVGVESAAFLEAKGGDFVPVCWKGFETADPSALAVSIDAIDADAWRKNLDIGALDKAPIEADAKKRLSSWGMPYVAPFVVHKNLRGLVLLGRPLREDFDETSWDYLAILVNQAAVAYENTHRFEEESERTLGLVQTMVSLIEENTITRGSTDQVMNYTYAVAQRMHYPEEYLRDLMYGAVLRDIGMIKISDLIVRSPRELVKEEWEIIKRHPIDGAEMLLSMNFSSHTTDIVMSHHERFNGEGYPNGLTGQGIPLGARIVSVVESYVAMIQDRPTRPALPKEEALNALKENWGIRYDPDVINEFAVIIEDEIRTGQDVKNQGSEILSL